MGKITQICGFFLLLDSVDLIKVDLGKLYLLNMYCDMY
jgi:hypothetical protein